VVAARRIGSGRREFRADRVVHKPRPRDHFIQVPVAVGGRQPRIRRSAEVALVDHLQPVPFEHRPDFGDTQRFGTHAGAASAGTDIGRCTDQ
jgi:hypothetical protein